MKKLFYLFCFSLILLISCDKRDEIADYQISVKHNPERQEFIMQIPSNLTITTIENTITGGKKVAC